MKRILGISIALVSLQFAAYAQDEINGYWLPEEGKSIIEIYTNDEGNQNGKIAWLEKPTNRKGEPHTDRMNPDKALRDRPLLGLNMLNDLIHKDGTWSGKLYTPKKGKTLDVALSLVNEDQLKVTVSFFGMTRNQFWTRTSLPE